MSALTDSSAANVMDEGGSTPVKAAAALPAAPFERYLGPLCGALLGASGEAVGAAVAADLASAEGKLRWFCGADAGELLVATRAGDAVAFATSLGAAAAADAFVALSRTDDARLDAAFAEAGEGVDLGAHCGVALSGRGGACH